MTRRRAALVLAGMIGLGGAAHAGQMVGNGGDALVCYEDGAVRSVELLDFFEARTYRGWEPTLGGEWLSPVEKARHALERFAALDPRRALLYLRRLETFCADTLFLRPDVPLPDINDSGYLRIPTGCQVEQAAVQKEPSSPFDKRFQISRRYWSNGCSDVPGTAEKELDADSKAGLILHELVFQEAIDRGQTHSVEVRFLTGLIASDAALAVDRETYRRTMLEKGFATYEHHHHWAFENRLYRFFDEPLLTRDEAKEFCIALPGLSRLAPVTQISHPGNDHATPGFVRFQRSAIANALRRDHPGRFFWLDGENYVTPDLNRPMNAARLGELRIELAHEDPATRAPFLCVVEWRD